MAERSFRSKVLDMRPDVAEAVSENAMKRRMALALRAVRKGKGMTQKDIAAYSKLTPTEISKI